MSKRIPPKCPVSGHRFSEFGGWEWVLRAHEHNVTLFYWAPLDAGPRPVIVRKAFKNRKLRIDAGEVSFTADPGHLDRFYWLERELA